MTKHTRTKSAPNPHQTEELTHNYLKMVWRFLVAVITALFVAAFVCWGVVLWFQAGQLTTAALLVPMSFEDAQTFQYVVVAKIDTTKPSVQYTVIEEPTLVASATAAFKKENSKKVDKSTQSNVSLGLGLAIEHILFVPDLPHSNPTLSQIKAGIWSLGMVLGRERGWNGWHQWVQLWGATSGVPDESVSMARVATLQEWQKTLQLFATGELSRECAVAVVNTTNQGGVAKAFARILEQSGLYVIRITDSFSQEATSQLIVNPAYNCEREVAALQSLTPGELLPQPDPEMARKYRADAVYLIGEDMAPSILNSTVYSSSSL